MSAGHVEKHSSTVDVEKQPSVVDDIELPPPGKFDAFRAPGADRVTLVKGRRAWSAVDGSRLQNNIHWTVGLMELANAGDFAANVWNEVPVPLHAVVLMAIGGTLAGIMCVFAFRDAIRAWSNVSFLRQQRCLFGEERRRLQAAGHATIEADVLYELTTRELRIELINRWIMDVLMGGGAMLIAIGTFLAIGGAHPKVWLASNILSGYLGNAPIALFGIVSALWAMHVCSLMQAHRAAGQRHLRGSPVQAVFARRCFNVQVFYGVNGLATVLGGAGSMLTATRWWGYCILIPVIAASFFCNVWWRKRVGYDRPLMMPHALDMTTDSLVDALHSATETRKLLEGQHSPMVAQLLPEAQSLGAVLEFLVAHGVFEAFCEALTKDKRLAAKVFQANRECEVPVDVAGLLKLSAVYQSVVLEVADDFLRQQGPEHFRRRERFLAELLGIYLVRVDRSGVSNGNELEK